MGIYEPAEDSFLLQKYVKQYAFGRVLDMGTGSGIQALTAIAKPDVREIVAVDINPEAIAALREKVRAKSIRKLMLLEGDLFDPVQGCFNLIIFNPPYLPQDKGVDDIALYGGKKGWEVIARFFNTVSPFLFQDGRILLLFSSRTGKDKVNEIIENHLFEYQQLETLRLPFFEELYVYVVTKSALLRDVEKRGVEQIAYFAKGQRGVVYKGFLDKSKMVKTHFPAKPDKIPVAIKVKREKSQVVGAIAQEARWLQRLNPTLGPRYLFEGNDGKQEYVAYEFVEGEEILDWMKHHSAQEIRTMLRLVLQQCYTLDQLGVSKEEMHHPVKHIIIDKTGCPTFIDFERCVATDKPQNVTQFAEFIARIAPTLRTYGIIIPPEQLRQLAGTYKQNYGSDSFRALISLLS